MTVDKDQASALEVELAVPATGTEQTPPQEPVKTGEADGETDQEDAGVAAGDTDEERSARAERRRRARERKRQEDDALRDEVAQYREIIPSLVNQVQSLSQQAQGNTLSAAQQALAKAEQDFAAAYETGVAAEVAKATKALTIAQLNFDAMQHRRTQQPRRQADPERQQPRQPANPYQSEWLSRNEWYRDPERAEDANIAHAISQTLVNHEGYEPNDPALYQELDRRLKKRGVISTGTQHTPGKVIVASGQRQSLSPPKKVVINPLAQEVARKFGFNLADKATAQRIGRRFEKQAAK